MKKQIIALIFILALAISAVFALTSCSGKEGEATTKAATTSAAAQTEETAATTDAASQRSEVLTKDGTKATSAAASNQGDSSVPPPILRLESLDELRKIKNALDTLNDSDLEKFLEENRYYTAELEDRESATAIINELLESTVMLLDGDIKNLPQIDMYVRTHWFSQIVVVDGGRKFIADVITPAAPKNDYFTYSGNTKSTLVKEISRGDAVIKIFNFEGQESYGVDIFVNGSAIVFWVNEKESLKDLEADLARMEFVTLGELVERES